ncbi:MAG: hypothetical protein QGG54_11100 [Gammaproteobacteria bacterium]|jgi:hypothetical protein|nr:hypothetical protein [Gammaproteobacteria bacterium]
MAPRSKLIGIIFTVLFLSASSFSVAQENVGDESTVRYPAAYFDEWSPVTA